MFFQLPQLIIGDFSGKYLAEYQPEKLAAAEWHFETGGNATLILIGVLDDGEVKYAIKIPYALSILAHGDPSAEVIGLDQFPEDEIPPLYIHYLFDIMVMIGMWMVCFTGCVLDRDKTTLENGDDKMVPLANCIRWTVVNHSYRSRLVAGRSRQAAVDSTRIMRTQDAATTSGHVDKMLILFCSSLSHARNRKCCRPAKDV